MKTRYKMAITLIVGIVIVSILAQCLMDNSEKKIWTMEETKNETNKAYYNVTYYINMTKWCSGWYSIGQSCGNRNCDISIPHNGSLRECYEFYSAGFHSMRRY
jgi:pyruvate/2-oxoacid:ferredoxin oxidoreductase beta subunit